MKVTSKRVHIQKSKYRLVPPTVSYSNVLSLISSTGSRHRLRTFNNQIMNIQSSSAGSSSKVFGVAGACSLALGSLLFGSYWLGNKRASNNYRCSCDQQQSKKKSKRTNNNVNQSVSLTSTASSGYHSVSNTTNKQERQQHQSHCSCCPFNNNFSELNKANVEHYCDSLAQEILTAACETTRNVYPHLTRYLLFNSNNNNNQNKKSL
ncbi:unnamed protein product, partial [Didymodactylos carnosus]